MYKLIALDLDGTLLGEDALISAENVKWVNRAVEAGFVVVVSTGRGSQSAFPLIEPLHVESFPAITVNGSEVWTRPHELKTRHLLDVDLIRRMDEIAVKYNVWKWAYAVEGMFNRERWTEDLGAYQWLKFGFVVEDARERREIAELLRDMDKFEITNSSLFNLEINPKGINKASGLIQVCDMLGLEMKEIIAVGDSLNDLAMIREVGLGVAMGNAQAEVKLAADVVTATNEQDGVAKVIQEYLLG